MTKTILTIASMNDNKQCFEQLRIRARVGPTPNTEAEAQQLIGAELFNKCVKNIGKQRRENRFTARQQVFTLTRMYSTYWK